MIVKYFKGIWQNRYILTSLVNKDLQLKYRRSKLGATWSILMPLGLSLIIGTIYSILFNADARVLIPLLFAGLNPWNFISGTADGGTYAYIAAEGYIKQVKINPQIFPLRVTINNFVNLLYSILAFFVIYMFIKPEAFSSIMLLCIPGLIIIFVFSLGLANITSVVNLFFRDYQPLQSLMFQALFYVTPIIYQTEIMDANGFSFIYKLNPFYYLLEIVRKPMLGINPGSSCFILSLVIAIIVFVVGVVIQMKNINKLSHKL